MYLFGGSGRVFKLRGFKVDNRLVWRLEEEG